MCHILFDCHFIVIFLFLQNWYFTVLLWYLKNLVENKTVIFCSFIDGPSYVTAFEPTQEAMMVAHHMRLFSCAPGIIFSSFSFTHQIPHTLIRHGIK